MIPTPNFFQTLSNSPYILIIKNLVLRQGLCKTKVASTHNPLPPPQGGYHAQ